MLAMISIFTIKMSSEETANNLLTQNIEALAGVEPGPCYHHLIYDFNWIGEAIEVYCCNGCFKVTAHFGWGLDIC